jgi:hypothetical protein
VAKEVPNYVDTYQESQAKSHVESGQAVGACGVIGEDVTFLDVKNIVEKKFRQFNHIVGLSSL